MKKILLLLALVLLLSACGKDTETNLHSIGGSEQPTTVVTEPSTTKPTPPPPTRPPVEVPEVEEVPVEEDTPFDFAECADLIGTWELTVNIPSNYANATDFTGSASFPVTFTFSDDGRYTVTLEPKSFEAAIHQYENALADYMIQGYYNKFVSEKKISDLSNKEIKARWEESGLANAQTQTHSFLDELALGATFGDLVRAGYYYAEAGELYLSLDGEYESFQYKIDEEGLNLSKSSRIRYYDKLCIRFPVALKPQ